MPIRPFLLLAGLLLLGVLTAAGCAPDSVTVTGLDEPAALAVTHDGEVLYGERHSGEVRNAANGDLVATVDVVSEGQRGLLGLTVSGGGATFAAWTRAEDGRLVVGQVAPGAERIVWVGPESKKGANGGRVAFEADGSLLVTVGSLRTGALTTDPDAVNGKLLRLDPAGLPDQDPEVVSGGWNNPFALAVADNATVWIADNDPGGDLERLDVANAGVALGQSTLFLAELPPDTAPSGLAILSDGSLAVCSYLRLEIQIYSAPEGAAPPSLQEVLDVPCRLGLVALPDDRLVYATDSGLETVSP